MSTKTKITFLGGLDTIGKNMMVLEYHNSAVIIDCGMTFPDDDMYGINIVIPNFEYLKRIKQKLKAVVITHGHEDHIGALGYLYREINLPLYATKMTLAFAEPKFSGAQRKLLNQIEVVPGKQYRFGDISIEPYSVCHSIPGGVGLIITTPSAQIVHSGDFKLEEKPLDGKITDLNRLKKLRNVDLLLCDSTNSDQPGRTISESMVGKTFEKIFAQTKGRIIIASFSSNLFRIQEAIAVAEKFNRRVAILGRNMSTNFAIAKKMGFIKCKESTIFDISQVGTLSDDKVVILTTGSQGERMSALTHMAKRIYEKMHLKREDTVIISASPIPGNEKDINSTVDNLYRVGVKIYYDQVDQIHASGHACSEEIKILTKAVQPRCFIPIHGEYKHLLINTELAQSVGVKKKNTLILQNGDQVEIDNQSCIKIGHINGDPVLIDGNFYASPKEQLFDERYYLSKSGVVLITCVLDKTVLVKEPVINGYGCLYAREIDMFLPILREKIKRSFDEYQKIKFNNTKEKENRLRRDIEKIIYDKLRRRPKVFINCIEL